MSIVKRTCVNRAFTLIELLVVVSVIGMLSSVILAGLQSAREKGRIGAGIKFATYNYRAFGANAIAVYDFNSGSDDDDVKDLSGNNLTLDLLPNQNGAERSSASPVSNNGGSYLSFDGNNDYAINTNVPSSLGNLGRFTISAWINPSTFSDGNFKNLVSLVDSTVDASRSAYIQINNAGEMILRQGNCINPNNDFALGIRKNVWQHIAATSDGINFSFYIDGRLIKKLIMAAACTSITPVSLYIGSWPPNLNYFAGSMDDVAVYTQALTTFEIEHLYAQGAARHGIAINE